MVLHSVSLLCKKRARGVLCNKLRTRVRDLSPIKLTALSDFRNIKSLYIQLYKLTFLNALMHNGWECQSKRFR